MKIVLVHNSYQEPGGEDVVFQRERDLLRAHGHEVFEYCRTNHEIRKYSPAQKLLLPLRTIWCADSKRELSELLRRVRPDLAHVHNTFPVMSPSIYSACQEQNVAVVQTLHNYRLLCPAATFYRDGKPCEACHDSLRHSVVHGCYRDSRLATSAVAAMDAWHRRRATWSTQVDCYITLTDFSRRHFLAAGFSPSKVRLKPNYVASDPGKRTGDGGHALYVGRLSREKGISTLLTAWKQLPGAIPLHIAGTGPLDVEVERAASQPNSRVEYLGQLPTTAVLEAMKGARFLVFTSELYENFPLVIAEAFACGLPVIASNRGAMAELVRHGYTGLLFTPGDAEDLANQVHFAWHNPDYSRELGRNARQEYETKYTAEQNYRMLMGIYEDVLAGATEPVNALSPAAISS